MAILSARYYYTKNDKKINGYLVSIKKSFVEKLNWDNTTELNIEIDKDYITIKKI